MRKLITSVLSEKELKELRKKSFGERHVLVNKIIVQQHQKNLKKRKELKRK